MGFYTFGALAFPQRFRNYLQCLELHFLDGTFLAFGHKSLTQRKRRKEGRKQKKIKRVNKTVEVERNFLYERLKASNKFEFVFISVDENNTNPAVGCFIINQGK